MNMKKLADIISDPAELAELQKCTSVSELVAYLNRAGADCTREEGLRFLRAWENVTADNENEEVGESGAGGGIVGFIRSVIRPGKGRKKRGVPGQEQARITAERILERMNRYAH